MNILLLGSGGREHALAWKLASSPLTDRLICAPGNETEALRSKGVEVIEVRAGNDRRPDLAAVAQELGQRGLTRVMVEGGAEVAAALMAAGLVDRLSLYRAGKILGGDSRSAVAALGLEKVDFAPRFSLRSSRVVGGDTLETWHRGA